MADGNKDTIYIDIDDEITTIIDKVRGSSAKVVALVLPKRATTLQSIVNMKLLKRAGDEAKKNLVLVTTESGLLPLAGAVGLHVAKTPTSRPEVPAGPEGFDDSEEQVDEDAEDLPLETDKSVGELAGPAAVLIASKPSPETGIETLELDNADPTPAVGAAAAGTAKKAAKPKKDKKLAIPDFDRFRLLLIGGAALLVLLVFLGYLAFVVLPKATINIKTNASTINTDVDFTLSTTATSLSESSNTVPAKQVQTQKTLTGSANATGQKNNGSKAQGSVTMTVCTNNFNATLPLSAGTGVSTNGKTYITQEAANFNPAGGCGGGQFRYRATDVGIVAQTGGASFNVNNADFKVSGRADISATGSASGGTDDIQTVISQADIDNAKAKINSEGNDGKDELKDQLDDLGYYPIEATYTAGEPAVTTSAKVGDASSTVTVTEVLTFTMLGAKEADLKKLVDNDIKGQIDTELQGILDQGIGQNSFKVKNTTATGASMNMQTTATVGPSIDTEQIAKDAAGKKSSEISDSIKNNPDVTDVEVKFSPFWVSKAPKASKITVNVAKPTDAN